MNPCRRHVNSWVLALFDYNRVPIHISLRTFQKNRKFTASAIIIHYSRRRWIQPTYDQATSTEHQHLGGCSQYNTQMVVGFSCSGPYNGTTLTKPPPDRFSYTPPPWPVWQSPRYHLYCDHECVCTLPNPHQLLNHIFYCYDMIRTLP